MTARLGRRIPKRLRSHLRAAREVVPMLPMAAGPAAARQLYRLERSTTAWRPHERTVPVRLRPLGGATVWVRPRSQDLYAVRDTFLGRYHVPPLVPGDTSVRLIWDLGANIGMTVAHLATLFPAARIRGVEMDDENAALCRRNVAAWADRCEILQAAIWPVGGGEVSYMREFGEEQSFRAGADAEGAPGERRTSPTLSLNELAARDDGPIDLVKMDIEGVERFVLVENVEWAERVRVIMVEVHEPYCVDDCVADLARLGFEASPDERHHAAVVGVRRDAQPSY